MYDEVSRVSVQWYPSSAASGDFAVRYHYDEHGFLQSIARRKSASEDGEVFWHALSAWPDGQIQGEERGNGMVSARTTEPASGRLTGIRTTWVGAPDTERRPGVPSVATERVVQNLVYEWSHAGNLHKRRDALRGQYEELEYDALSRLRFSHLRPAGSTDGTTETRYDALGNIRFRSDLGEYRYEAPRGSSGVRPHAVSLAGAIDLRYDELGRMNHRRDPSTGLDQEIRYFQFGKPSFASGTATEPYAWFEYDADGNRLVRETATAHTTTIGDLYERVVVPPGATPRPDQPREQHRFFVHAGSRLVAQVTRRIWDAARPASRDDEVTYVNDDHLGSTDVVSNARGEVVESRSFAALGAPRGPAWSEPPAPDALSSTVPRGFTGHEDDLFGLINMGGRIYDPKIGRFLQPDPFVQGLDGQGLNRYSYVHNNPLSATDPSGYMAKEIDPTHGIRPSDMGEWSTVTGNGFGISGTPLQALLEIDELQYSDRAVFGEGMLVASNGRWDYGQEQVVEVVDKYPRSLNDLLGYYIRRSYQAEARWQNQPAGLGFNPLAFLRPRPLRGASATEIANVIFNEVKSLWPPGSGANSGPPTSPELLAAFSDYANAIFNIADAFGTAWHDATVTHRSMAWNGTWPSDFANRQLAAKYKEIARVVAIVVALRTAGFLDPTRGATHFNQRRNDWRGAFQGDPIRTQRGPFNNSYPTQTLPGQDIYINTYR